jgi:hypothetical protein
MHACMSVCVCGACACVQTASSPCSKAVMVEIQHTSKGEEIRIIEVGALNWKELSRVCVLT